VILNILKKTWDACDGMKTNGGLLGSVLPLVLMQAGLSHDETESAILAGTSVISGIVALVGFAHKIIKKIKAN
jgi:hypothetical protein